MTKQEVIKLAGSQRDLALLLDISSAAISRWKEIPKARIWQLMILKPEWFM
jgi:predicted transcriptional regulator